MSLIPRGLRAAVLTAAAVAVATIAGVAQSANGAATFPNSLAAGGHLTTSMNMFGGAKVPSTSAATALAQANGIIVVGAYQQLGGFAPAMLAANPNLNFFVYQNGMYSAFGGYPSDWYMRDHNGNRIQSAAGLQYLMNPNSTSAYAQSGTTSHGWTEAVGKGCNRAMTVAPTVFSGCWVDMLGTAPLTKSYNVNGAVPWNTQTAAPYTTAEWIQLTGGVASAVGAATGRPVLGNGLSSGPVFYAGNRALLNYTDGGHAESWLRNAAASITWRPSLSKWADNVNMLMDAAAGGKAVQVTVKTWTSSTSAQREAWRSFAYASYLIGNSGTDYFQFSPSHSTLPWSDLSPLYSLPLGSPLFAGTSVSDYLRNGVYERAFSTGLVVVNPGTSAVTVPLDATYYDTAGRSYTTSLTIAAGSGMVLTTVH
jgi:hypothetical protein